MKERERAGRYTEMREKEAGLRNEAVGEERAELPEQAVAVVRVDDERQRIAQVEAVNAEQGLRVDRVAAGNQIDLIRAGSEKIDEFFDLLSIRAEGRRRYSCGFLPWRAWRG